MDIRYYVINMDKDGDRLERFRQQMDAQGLSFTRHAGPLLQKNTVSLFGKTFRVTAPGYAGVALAHIRLWQKIGQLENDACLCNVFEDDEILRANYAENLHREIEKIPGDIDFFNLNVIRPLGKKVAPDILKVVHPTFSRKRYPNIWLSNYVITPGGARRILKLLEQNMKHLNMNFDKTFVETIHRSCDQLNCYILAPMNKLSIHDEDESSKKEMNNKNWVLRMYGAVRDLFRG
ncbi:glycosyltransferase family 25 protein [Chitinivibrio alkaliphilus]|uniref:Glycosyltransferase family 25 n=1 Tax=Chitinivibrio alkaliphilus ACht1 TaxID=1313304 RepID=U7D4D1_9BACT|nr:glycosyltransferase family 25 protein [Chitinivibrio alkaliphilus]ERP31339.1 Glycosyltransferase family 25 [Chitinivibrio alkaliphilus ACht1]